MMNVSAIDIVFRRVIAEQTQVEKIRGTRQEFEGSKISFVKWSGIGPHPANAIFFQEPDDLWPMPSGMTKFNRKTEAPWQLCEKFTQCRLGIFGSKGRRKLDEDNLKLWRDRLDSAQKRIQLDGAIAQPAAVRDLAGKFTGETEPGRSHFDPTPHRFFRGSSVKGGINFHGREVVRVEFEPSRARQILRIKNATPVVKTPRACADADFLLIGQIQMKPED